MTKFKGSVRLENTVQFSEAFSPDEKAVTIIFSNLLVDVGNKSEVLVATQVASFTLPTLENDTELPVQMFIRGFVSTEPGTRTLLVAHLAGTSASLATLPEKEDNYQLNLETTLPAGCDVQATLFLLAERAPGDKNHSALLVVDSLDFNLGPQPS